MYAEPNTMETDKTAFSLSSSVLSICPKGDEGRSLGAGKGERKEGGRLIQSYSEQRRKYRSVGCNEFIHI